MRLQIESEKLQHLNRGLNNEKPQEIISWAWKFFSPYIAVSSSFQMQSLPLLHMISVEAPELPIIFIDTGYHFPETLAFRDQLIRDWNLNVRIVRSSIKRSDFIMQYGENLFRKNPDLCCLINKVEPMKKAVSDLNAWISGIRRDQSPNRANIEILEKNMDGLIRIHPLAGWTRNDIWKYINTNNLPEHPLLSKGYLSIGCAPCTRPVFDDDERSGRWAGKEKTECGLHTKLRQVDTIQETNK